MHTFTLQVEMLLVFKKPSGFDSGCHFSSIVGMPLGTSVSDNER